MQAAASKRPIVVGRGGQDSVRPFDEDAIWQSEMRLKGPAGGTDTKCCVPPTCVMEAFLNVVKNNSDFLSPKSLLGGFFVDEPFGGGLVGDPEGAVRRGAYFLDGVALELVCGEKNLCKGRFF